MYIFQLVGISASILGAATFLPEVMRAFKTRHLHDIAWGMLLLLVINSLLWMIYGFYFSIFPVLLSASLNFVMGAILVQIKWRSERRYLIAIPTNSFKKRLLTD